MATQWTLLSLVQEFCRRQNLDKPSAVATSQDETITQAWGLLNEEVTELRDRGDWKERHLLFTFYHAGGANYLAFDLSGDTTPTSALQGTTPLFIIRDTLWDQTLQIPVTGPLTDQQWQEVVVRQTPTAVYQYRLSGQGICIFPVPTLPTTPSSPGGVDTSHLFSVEAVIREVIRGSSALPGPGLSPVGSTMYKDVFTADDDVCLLPGHIVLAGLRWRYRMEKGLPYAEHKATYETVLSQALQVNRGPQSVNMGGDSLFPQVVKPGLLIPVGSWNV